MARDYFINFDPKQVPSPCFVVDEVALEHNLQLLAKIEANSGAKILLALKAFAMFSMADKITKYLSGTCSSGLHEAMLGREEFGGEVHTFSVAYRKAELIKLLQISDYLIFNSFSQWHQFKDIALAAQKKRPNLRFGLRINPCYSEVTTIAYNPCSPTSRLGIVAAEFKNQDLTGISGLHFHTLCEQGFPPLQRTIAVIEEQFGLYLPQMEWVNFGGGHQITQANYQTQDLISLIRNFSQKYALQVYLEPGEAIASNAGILVTEVLDIKHNNIPLAILDTSAVCHMPDILEMPYRPHIMNSGKINELAFNYQLGGSSCLAGDVIGDYSFAKQLSIGDCLVFNDMAFYTMVKTNTFNGMPLPAIAIWNSSYDQLQIIKEFGYQDFKERLS